MGKIRNWKKSRDFDEDKWMHVSETYHVHIQKDDDIWHVRLLDVDFNILGTIVSQESRATRYIERKEVVALAVKFMRSRDTVPRLDWYAARLVKRSED
jgi:hypothetical protein